MVVILTLQWLIIAFQIGLFVTQTHLTRKGIEKSYVHDLQVIQWICFGIVFILMNIGFFILA